jgi:5-methylthioadenosine/S-adenosylhomocysteine deaminase
VLSHDGMIVSVGDADQVRADPRAVGARLVDWSHRAIFPGTVNAHNHSFQSLPARHRR